MAIELGTIETGLNNHTDGLYTIIATVHTYGSLTQVTKKEKVRETCERLKKALYTGTAQCYKCIEVVNNETGEIREYWNNHDNKINF